MQIIPAIDIMSGKCVRLQQGDFSRATIYDANPLQMAMQFEDSGITRLHLVDLDGAAKGSVVNLSVLESIASATKLLVDFGGGIKTADDINSVFNAGAGMAAIGSIALKNKNLFWNWLDKFGAEKILLGADVKDEKIAVGAWLENSEADVFTFIREHTDKGVRSVFCTDITKDGLLEGPSLDLYKRIMQSETRIKFIASGGISSLKDLDELENIGCYGAIVGRAFYEGKITLSEIEKRLNKNAR